MKAGMIAKKLKKKSLYNEPWRTSFFWQLFSPQNESVYFSRRIKSIFPKILFHLKIHVKMLNFFTNHNNKQNFSKFLTVLKILICKKKTYKLQDFNNVHNDIFSR